MSVRQHYLIAQLAAIRVTGLVERHFDREVDTYVTVSVDGEQQLETGVYLNSLNPEWHFPEPLKLMVHASSILKFTLYRRRKSRDVFGDKLLGQVEDMLYTYVTNPGKLFELPSKMNWVHRENAALSVNLDVDYSSDAHEVLDNAEEKLCGAFIKTARGHGGPMAEALTALGDSIESLDQLVQFVDGVVDIHPMCKAAWTLLSSVYKAFKSQRAQDAAMRELAVELKDTLAHVRLCRNIHDIPGAGPVVQELARLVAECASLMDESISGAVILRAARSAASQTLGLRAGACARKLKSLQTKFDRLMAASMHNDVSELKDHIQFLHNRASSPPPPPPPPCYCSPYASPLQQPMLLPSYPYASPHSLPELPISVQSLPSISQGDSQAPIMPMPIPRPSSPSPYTSPQPRVLLSPAPLFSSPAPSLSSIPSFCFSPPGGTPASSCSSFVPLPEVDMPQGRVLPGAPYVAEPEQTPCLHRPSCCQCSRSSSVCSRAESEVQAAGYKMLWG